MAAEPSGLIPLAVTAINHDVVGQAIVDPGLERRAATIIAELERLACREVGVGDCFHFGLRLDRGAGGETRG